MLNRLLYGLTSIVKKDKRQDVKIRLLIANLHKADEANFKIIDQNKPLSKQYTNTKAHV